MLRRVVVVYKGCEWGGRMKEGGSRKPVYVPKEYLNDFSDDT
jgi:hypothetical protein